MTRVEVRLELSAGAQTVGHLLDTGQHLYFEYTPAFIARGLELSPFKLPIAPGVHEAGVPEFHGLHGLFFDSLPDGWGLLLMHRRMWEQGIAPNRISVLAWLRHLGMRSMGALSYHPAEASELDQTLEVKLADLATEAVAVLRGEGGAGASGARARRREPRRRPTQGGGGARPGESRPRRGRCAPGGLRTLAGEGLRERRPQGRVRSRGSLRPDGPRRRPPDAADAAAPAGEEAPLLRRAAV